MNSTKKENKFELLSSYQPSGDQPKAINELMEGLKRGDKHQVLLGVTGSGKTYTMSNIIKEYNRFHPHQRLQIITPADTRDRGCQLSLVAEHNGREIFNKLTAAGIVADWREPDVIRMAPVPLYNTFEDVFRVGAALESLS